MNGALRHARMRRTLAGIALLLVGTAAAFLRVSASFPEVHIRWREGTTVAERVDRERRYELAAGEVSGESAVTWQYELGNRSRENIAALLADPLVEDTHNINRDALTAAPRSISVSLRAPPEFFSELRLPSYTLPGLLWLLIVAAALAGVSRLRKAAGGDARALGEFGFVVFLAAGLSLIHLHLKLEMTTQWDNGTLVRNHQQLLAFQYFNNEQSRVLQWLIPELLRALFGLSIQAAYMLQRWLFTTAAFVLFHFYLRKWFDPIQSVGIVGFLAAIVPLTFRNDLQESSNLLLATFVLGLWLIREGRYVAFMAMLWIGALNNETMLILSAVVFFVAVDRWAWPRIKAGLLVTAWVSIPAWATTVWIRYLTRDRPHLGGAWHLPDNLNAVMDAVLQPPWQWIWSSYTYFLLIFGAAWWFAFDGWADRPLFLRRAALCIPLFLIAHLLTGVVEEARQMVPLAAIVLPMAFLWLKSVGTAAQPQSEIEMQAPGSGVGERL